MERIQEHEILEFHSDTLSHVRGSCGLESPGRVDEAIDILQDWVTKQEHFLKKDFSRTYLETTLMAAKGSIEKAKQNLDTIFTTRTFVPQLFGKFDAKNAFSQLHKVGQLVVLPKMTDDHYRVIVLKQSGKPYEHFHRELFQFASIMLEYLRLHDYFEGMVFILDPRNINPLEFLPHVNLTEFSNAYKLFTKGYGARMKGLHGVVDSARGVDLFLTTINQFVSAKIASRIHVHKTLEELHKLVPKRILPEDLGGEERSIDTLYDQWLIVYSKHEHVQHMREMQEARTDESRRRSELKDTMFGVPGTFRGLKID